MKTLRSSWPHFAAFVLAFAGVFLSLSAVLGQEKGHSRGYIPLTPERRAQLQAISKAKHGTRIAEASKFLALPPAFDCRDKVPLAVWDQGNCGSCYLDSTVRCFTCAGIYSGFGKADGSFMLAVQYGMDRPRNFGGCGGGNGTEVADWIVKNGWIAEKWVDTAGVSHNDYPAYTASSGSDRTKPGARVWAKGWDWGFVNANGSPTVEEIKAALFLHGRLNIAIDAGGGFGASGTITSLGNSIDHEINVAAWDDNHDNGNGTKGAFLLENQWGEEWSGSGAGPGCKWCSYGASKHIVDWFFVLTGTVPPPPPPPPPGNVAIAPPSATLIPGATQQFTVSPAGNYSWSASGGSVTATGLFTAPTAVGNYTVSVTVAGDPTKFAIAAVTVSTTPPPQPPPGPGIIATIDIDKPIPAGKWVILAPGFEVVPIGTSQKVRELADLLKREKEGKAPKAPPPMAPAPDEQAKTIEPPVITPTKVVPPIVDAPPTFGQQRDAAVDANLPLIVGVGCPIPRGDWFAWRTDVERWRDWNSPCLVVWIPKRDGWLYFVKSLPAGATKGTIQQTLMAATR